MATSKNKRPTFKRRINRPELTAELEAFINGADEEGTGMAKTPAITESVQKPQTKKAKKANTSEVKLKALLKPKKKTKPKLFNLRLPEDLHGKIEDLASVLNISMHEVVLTIVDRGVAQERKAHGLD